MEKLQRFSIRKLSIGAVSCLIGTVSFLSYSHKVQAAENSQTVETAKAENEIQPENVQKSMQNEEAKGDTQNAVVDKNTVGSQETGAVTTANQTSPKENVLAANEAAKANEAAVINKAEANKLNGEDAIDKASINTTNTVKANVASISSNKAANTVSISTGKTDNITPIETKENKTGSVDTIVSKTSTVSNEAKPNIIDSAMSTKIKLQAIRLAKPVNANVFAESKVATESKVTTDNQFNFDDWITQTDNNYLNITGYKGDNSKQIIVPNGADFAKAGKNNNNLQVAIDKKTLAGLIVNGVAPKLSNTNGQKIVAKGSDWSRAFANKNLHDISGLANLDTSNVTDMSFMFYYNSISDLNPLANWNTSNVTNMAGMFVANQLVDLRPLANWNTSNVTNMARMFADGIFGHNNIRDLIPLASWDISNVTNMSGMFYNNLISNLNPLASWNTSNVTNMNDMFGNNYISNLSPLARWNTGNVTNMDGMFYNNLISDLSPLTGWNTGNVTTMGYMFGQNHISNLSPLSGWNTSKVTEIDNIFSKNPLNVAINDQSTLNKFHAAAYKLDNAGALTSHSESKTFNDGSQILLDKDVVTNRNLATLTFKANGSKGDTYQIKIYNPERSINIQAPDMPATLGTTDTSYQDGYTIITNKFINTGSVKQDISITLNSASDKAPRFAQYESTSGLINVAKDEKDLGSTNITYQNLSDVDTSVYALNIGDKLYVNHTQNIFSFRPQLNNSADQSPYSLIKSDEFILTVPDDVTIDPDTFTNTANGKALKATKIAKNQYKLVLNGIADEITVKGSINIPPEKATDTTIHLPGFGMKYTISTYNDKMKPIVATGTSKELSVIYDLARYRGELIKINQSKWAFDRSCDKRNDFASQGFTNSFNDIPLKPIVSVLLTNAVETFNMPDGVNITRFEPPFNKKTIDHIEYILKDGSTRTSDAGVMGPIRQMKVYFKNGVRSDDLSDSKSDLYITSFDATYPDGKPVKDFDTFNVTGSFSCDELGSTGNVDVTQIMLAPTPKLTDGMRNITFKSESDKKPGASGDFNFISGSIENTDFQHQGHLTNPIFYFKYNDLMVPNMSKISVSYENLNKSLGKFGTTNIDQDKIHSSIITDSTGQKFIKIQVDGEYHYAGKPGFPSRFDVNIPIINSPDALTATKDWSWYVLNNNNESETESLIQNSGSGDEFHPITIDGHTLFVGGTGTWQIIVAQGFTSTTETQGNLNAGPGFASTQDVHRQDPTHFNIYASMINATDDIKNNLVSVTNLPSTQDGKSQFNVHMTGKANLINVMTGQAYDATITYSYNTGDNNFITGDQVTDWSKVKSIKVVPNGGAPAMTSLRLVVPVEDKTVYDDVGKTIYMSTMTYGEDKANNNYTTKDGFAVPEKSTILPIIIKAGDKASAKLTVQGQATVHTLIHYKDASGKDVYVKLADKDNTYNELQDTMKRSDYLQSDSDLTTVDRKLLPVGMIINYNDPTIRNSNNTYAAGYANNVAAFDKIAKYDFDGDQVIFEGAMPENVTKNNQVTETIHYVYSDGRTAASDKVLTSTVLKQTGSKNPFTGEITWDEFATDTLNSVNSPVITGYTADQLTVPKYVVTIDSKNKEVTVTYAANAQTAKITYIDDTEHKTLSDDTQNGEFNQVITFKHDPTEVIKGLEGKGYKLVSNDFNSNKYQADDSKNVFHVHFVHGTKNVSRDHLASFTVHYIYKDSRQAKPDHKQTLSFTENGIQDLVTQETTWTPANNQKFDDVATPVINGYTPDQDKVIGQTANFETDNRDVTVTYSPNVQLGHINYIDDNTGKILTRDDFSGRTNEHEDYKPIDRIQEFENKGYELVSNNYPDGGFTFDDNDQQDQVFNVHLKHGIVTVTSKNPQIPNTTIDPDPHSPKYPKDISNTNSDVKRTIDYNFKNGKTAQPAVKDSLHFERTVVIDKVTGDVLSDTWTQSQNFNDIQTPAIQGYTPDRTVVSDKNIGHDHQDIIEHVVYNPDAQHMTIAYIDDTTGETLHTDKRDGVSDQDAKYTTSDTVKQYEDQHYKLVSDSTNGKDLIFDHDDNADQTYEVHFVHSEHAIDQTTSPKQTIHYVYANGLAHQGKAADDSVQQLSFKRDGYNDEVTGIDHWNAWTPVNSQYKAVDSPVIQGYTPDKSVIEKSTVNPTDKDTEITVVYNADTQAARVIYIDKTTNATLTSNNLSGKSDKDSGYNTKDTIEKYQSQHYVLTGDETNGKNVIFDHDDKQNQTYYVYFVHGTQKVNRQDTVTSTIDYKFEDGKTAQPAVTQTKQFSEDGIKDLVTGKITWAKAEPQKFNDVTTPTISGYTPNKDKVAGNTVNFGDKDITNIVIYTPNKQKAKVVFIDDTTKKTLDTHDLIGVTNSHENYDPSKEIDEFVHKHYVLVPSDDPEKDYPEKGFTYDNNDDKDQVFEVHFVHGSHNISEKKSITETITYTMSDGSKAPNKVEKQVEFSRVGKHDDVTNIDTWNEWQPNKQNFSAVPTPDVKGYTPDIKLVEAKTVTSGDKDITITITYTPDKQKAKVVFIDDTTKKILDTHDLIGVTNGHEKYNPSEEIKKFIHDNYVFVSSDYPEKGFTYDNDDGQDQVFEVHLKERPTESDTPTIPGNTEDNSGSNDTPTTDSDEPEKDNGGSDTVDKSSHKTPVKRNSNKKHHGTKKINSQKNANKKHQGTKQINNQKNAKTAKLNPNEVNARTNKLTQTKLGKVQESANNTLPQTGEKQSSSLAALGLAISSLGMIGAVKSKKRKDN